MHTKSVLEKSELVLPFKDITLVEVLFSICLDIKRSNEKLEKILKRTYELYYLLSIAFAKVLYELYVRLHTEFFDK